MSKKTIVVSAFPACGKTYAYKNYQDKYSILDSDSSYFSWKYETERDDKGNPLRGVRRVRNPEFPNNYIKHIQENIGKVDFILVSSHLQVREAMERAGINYVTVYPKKEMLNEWVGRMYRRGNDKNFIDFQISHWDEFVGNIENEPYGSGLCRLWSNEYLDLDFLYNWQCLTDKIRK